MTMYDYDNISHRRIMKIREKMKILKCVWGGFKIFKGKQEFWYCFMSLMSLFCVWILKYVSPPKLKG